ncbi:hypothetical protein CPC698_1158, partial [Chlamydia psittaci C6/98]
GLIRFDPVSSGQTRF